MNMVKTAALARVLNSAGASATVVAASYRQTELWLAHGGQLAREPVVAATTAAQI